MTPKEFRGYQVPLDQCNRILQKASLAEAHSVCRFPRGEVSACFALELADESRVVLKVQIRTSAPQLLFAEREACALLCAAGVPVPEVLRVDVSEEVLPHGYSLLTWLPGQDVVDALPGLEPADRRQVVRSLGRRLAQVHAVRRPAADASVLPWRRTIDKWAAERECEFRKLVREHRLRGFIPRCVLDRAEAAWEKWHQYLGHGHLCLLHGDGNLANAKVCCSRPEVTGIFDFDQTDVGEAEFDFAPMETWRLEGWEEHLRAEFHAGYREQLPFAPGHGDRVRAYTLLRDLRIVLAYQGPNRPPYGAGSSTETIQRLIGEA